MLRKCIEIIGSRREADKSPQFEWYRECSIIAPVSKIFFFGTGLFFFGECESDPSNKKLTAKIPSGGKRPWQTQ